jgi:threonylcarbamoyladenosine tRNA methylthiotransferase MtaB
MNKTFTIQTLGCKVNQYESEAIAWQLKQNGFELKNRKAFYAIINTCTVTQKAGMQSRQLIRQTIRKHPDALIIVTGCHAQVSPKDIQDIDGVHWIVGHAYKHELPHRIQKDHPHLQKPGSPEIFISNILSHTAYGHIHLDNLQKRSRPMIKIQDGCNAFCSYCIVPYARGPSRSLPEKQVVDTIKRFRDNQYKEIILTGIHLGRYGHDLIPPIELIHLLNKILQIPDCPRIRLSSIEPLEISKELIQILQTSPKMCHHLHIPMQSGDDQTLKQMNRHYTRGFFHDLIESIHESIPDIAIGIDVLTGFPTETHQAFENTLSLLDRLPAAYFHVFPFSLRNGTCIAKQKIALDIQTIKTRARIIRELGAHKRMRFYQKSIGQRQWVIVESSDSNYSNGLTGNYIPVKVTGSFNKNDRIHVQLKRVISAKEMQGQLI